MKLAVVSGILIAAALAACSAAPGSGPRNISAVTGAGKARGAILYDVVKVDNRVVSTVLAQPKTSFRALFTPAKPPPQTIAVGDTIAVVIWEAGPGGLFTAPLPPLIAPSANPTIEPPEIPTPPQASPGGNPALNRLLGLPLGGEQQAPGEPPQQGEKTPAEPEAMPPAAVPANRIAANRAEAALAEEENRRGAVMPLQQVGRDGTITIPYAGSVPVAGRTAAEAQSEIEARLAKKAIAPQVLVVDEGGPAHAVAVTGAVVHGALVPLSPDGDRLLQVIAEAGGARAPVRDLFVRLSRGGVTARLPLATLVEDPAQNIYAWPGDVLTLVRRPRTFSVFGAANGNAQIPFGAATLTLSQALGKAHGLRQDIADARGVFLFRYENDAVLRALGEPLAAAAQDGVSPVVYRFNMKDPKGFFLARRFPVRNRDVIFVVDAGIMPFYRWFRVVNKIIGPVEQGFIVCATTSGC
jgi:protein involved in polysaccharide export with SLBB domain